jgi:DNA-binding CsgD family transcriptional regulator/tetratricopeptide (TPR) repeat protein
VRERVQGPWPLVGRQQELEVVSRAVRRGRPVLLHGDAGVGKTRLLREVADALGDQGWYVRTGAGTDTARSLPLGAVAHLIPAEALDGPRESVLRSIVSTIEATTAEQGRVLVCLDDVHLLDEASATLAWHLARQTSPRFGVVLAIRAGREAPEALLSLSTDDVVERIDLRALDEDDIGALVEAGLEGPVDPLTVALLARWTRGNVLFLRELVRDGVDQGALLATHGVWTWHGPPTVGPTLRQLINARHARLDGDARAALELIAVGEPIALSALARLVPDEMLAELVELELVEIDQRGGPGGVRIAHPVHAEALRGSVSAGRAKRLRLDVARAMRDADGPAADRLRVAVLLADGGEAADAGALIAAARRAWALRDHTLVERLASAALASGPNPEAEYLLGETLSDRGDFDGAAAAWLAILDRPLPEPILVQAAIAAASVLALTLNRADDARAVLDRAAAQVSSADARARLAGSRASLFLDSVSTDDLEAAAATYADPGAPDQGRVLAWIGSARDRLLAGRADSVVAEADAITVVAERAADELPMGTTFVGICRFIGLVGTGRLDEAEAFAEAARQDALTDPVPVATATWSQGLGVVALTRGHLDRAIAHLGAAAALLRGHDIGNLRHVLHELGLALAISGDAEGVARAMSEATNANSGLIEPFVEDVRIDAALLAAQGDIEGARSLLLRRRDETKPRDGYYDLPLLHDLVRFGAAEEVRDEVAYWAKSFDGYVAGLYLDQADALLGDDLEALGEVADRFDRLGYDLDAAETVVAASEVAAARGQQRHAQSLVRRAEVLLARCGDRPHRTPMLASRGPLRVLTDRERQVAQLAGGGLTDAEVAERLSISVRTVHAHLRSSYAKLGVTNRTELRAALAAGIAASGS